MATIFVDSSHFNIICCSDLIKKVCFCNYINTYEAVLGKLNDF